MEKSKLWERGWGLGERDLLGVLSTAMPILQGQQLQQKGDGLLTDLKKYRWEGAQSTQHRAQHRAARWGAVKPK